MLSSVGIELIFTVTSTSLVKVLWNGFIQVTNQNEGIVNYSTWGRKVVTDWVQWYNFYLAKEPYTNEQRKNQTAGDYLPILSHTASTESATIPKVTPVDFSKAILLFFLGIAQAVLPPSCFISFFFTWAVFHSMLSLK